MRTELGIDVFAALNHAGLADVACVHVPENTALAEPLHLVHISTGAGSAPAGHSAEAPPGNARCATQAKLSFLSKEKRKQGKIILNTSD